jgi:hypothetical protein
MGFSPGSTRFAAVVGVAALVVVLSTGCAGQATAVTPAGASASNDQPTPHAVPTRSSHDVNDAAAIEQEYKDAVGELKAQYSLPQGRSYPSASMLTWDPAVHVGTGFGESAGNFFWRCAWSDQYFTASTSGDVKARNAALDKLEKWPSTPFFLAHVQDSEPGWQKAVIDPARAGDDSVLRAMSGSDCTFYYNVTAP